MGGNAAVGYAPCMSGNVHVDVVVVGAGLSGIGAACHLQRHCPDRSYAILEARARMGGTWDLFRYPGIRSDSDMHTLGYSFRPWKSPKAIADGPSILAYIQDTAREFGVERHIRYGHRVYAADWSARHARWTVRAHHGDEEVSFTCSYLYFCAGYYRYSAGHEPEFPGRDDFGGIVVHPQKWPEGLDYAGKKVVIIGSGATAVTLVPAMAETADHVTMLQRSPTYMIALPDEDAIANRLKQVLPERVAYRLVRAKNTRLLEFAYRLSRRRPAFMRRRLLARVRKQLGPDYDVDTHFTPRYGVWDQRLCLVPNGDLFTTIRGGRASVVTDHIERFTADGIALRSGEHLPADIIVTATGLHLVTIGQAQVTLDGEAIDFSKLWSYKGFAYSDVPNLGTAFGYINASWTLRADLVSEYVCRLLNHMRATGTSQCTPRLRPSDHDMTPRPYIENFTSAYLQRILHELPRQGDRPPWVNTQSYRADRALFGSSIDDGVMQFTGPQGPHA